MKTWRKSWVGPGLILMLILIGLAALIVLTDNSRPILDALFGPQAFLLLIVALIVFLVVQGSDRSAIYRRELVAARRKRRDDLLAMREMESRLVDMRARIAASLDRDPGAENCRAAAEDARAIADDVLRLLRERI